MGKVGGEGVEWKGAKNEEEGALLLHFGRHLPFSISSL